MKVNPTVENIQKWCKALRSGKFRKTKNKLQDENGYCCLGVACVLFIPKRKLKTTVTVNGLSYIVGYAAEDQTHSPQWLKDVNSLFFQITNEHLSVLNDSKEFTFDEIADLLEAVFIHKVLD